MAYCTQSDIVNELPLTQLTQLADDDGDGSPDSAVVSAAIAKADSDINSYCAGRYLVPFSPVPDVIKNKSVIISIYYLYLRRSAVPEIRKDAHEKAIAFLKDVSKGAATLGTEPAPAAGTQVDLPATSSDPADRIFTIKKGSEPGTLDNY